MVKSPGGSNYPYYYLNGELHGVKYGSFGDRSEALLKLMDAELAFMLARPEYLNVWIDCYQTTFNRPLLDKLKEQIKALEGKVTRLALVGLPRLARIKLAGVIKEVKYPVRHYKDPEAAKTWIIKGR